MFARTKLAAIGLSAAAALALTGCGGGDDDATVAATTSASAPAPSASAPATTPATTPAAPSDSATAPVESASSASGPIGDLEGCSEAAGVGLAIAGVGLEGLGGNFDQAAYDKAFPAGKVDSLPEGIQAEYTAAAEAAKEMIGKSTNDVLESSSTYGEKLEAYSKKLTEICS